MERSTDRATLYGLETAAREGITTIWDRYEAQLPQCNFGSLGVCCRMCLQGPCRIDPFGEGATKGICGATADTIVARNLARFIAGGTAAHSGHAKHLAHTMLKMADGTAPDYSIRDEAKLKAVAARQGVAVDGRPTPEIARDVARAGLLEFSEREEPLAWLATTVTPGRMELFTKLGILPMGIDSTIAEVMHATTYGVDADPVNILLTGLKCSLSDYAGMHLGTDLSDALFGTPTPRASGANLGTLRADSINVAVHGHNPVLSDIICEVAVEMDDEAKAAGAPGGFNLVGVCCTGMEVQMRHGIPWATSSLSQELVITTGALEAMVVDYQCIQPSVADVAACYHTRVITTMTMAKMPGATHIEFTEELAKEKAREILQLAIESYPQRDPKRVDIPDITSTAFAGFSTEAIVGALAKVNPDDPLKPLVDNIANGNILGVCLFAGCNDVKATQDENFIVLAKALAKENVLLLATGCASGAFGRHGIFTQEAVAEYAGDGLKAVLTAVGEANGLGGPLPLALHMGSCVDNTRAADVAVAVANYLGVDLDKLPVVATAPEEAMEKAVSIGTWAVTMGLPTHVGVVPPVLGSAAVAGLLTGGIKDVTGGWFIVEPDPAAAARALLAALVERREGLNLPVPANLTTVA
ncbi:MAG: anaerobic carbon-monoxide dehydrogenase catalytic subunit [Thermoleophilia bacterium]